MNNHAKRLVDLIDELNLNTRSFAITCGFSQPTTIYSVIKNNSKLTKNTLDKICNRFPEVNRNWLLTGLGKMFNETNATSDDLTVTAKQVIDNIENQIQELTSKIKSQTEESLNTLIVPKMLRHDLVTKADGLLDELGGFLNEFKELKKELTEMKEDILNIYGKITNISFIETVKAIEEKTKKENGGIDMN